MQQQAASALALPSNVRVWLACGHTDMRRGFDALASQVQQQLGHHPFDGQFFVFRGKHGDLIKILSWDGQRLRLLANYLVSYCSSFGLIRGL